MSIKKTVIIFCVMQLFGQLFSQSIDDYFTKGWEFFNKKDYENALKNFNDAVILDPSNPSAYYYRAQAYMKLTKFKPALDDLNTAIGIKNTSYQYFQMRGVVNNVFKDYNNALSDFNTSLSFKSDNPSAYSSKAQTNFFLLDYKNTLNFYDKAIKLDPANAYIYFLKLYASYRINQTVDDKILKIIEDKKYLFNDWAKVIANLIIDKITPEQALEKAKGDDELCEIYFYIAMKYLFIGQDDKAKEFYQKCISINIPTFSEYMYADYELNKK